MNKTAIALLIALALIAFMIWAWSPCDTWFWDFVNAGSLPARCI